jgi:hypothetical protein
VAVDERLALHDLEATFPAVARPGSRLLLLLALVLVGCGGGDPPAAEQVRDAVKRFGDATARKDYQVICDELLARDLVDNVESIGLPCEVALQRGLGEVQAPRLEVGQVAVSGDRALVSVRSTAAGQQPSDDGMELIREDDGWRIASLAQPEGGGQTTVPTPDQGDRTGTG